MTENLFDLTGKVAVVTGASRGLGQYLGRALARAGADLVITSRKMPDLKQFQAEIEGLGRQVLPLELDLRDAASIRAAADAAASHFGKVDVLVNNAGCNVRKPALDVTWRRLEHMVKKNALSAIRIAIASYRQQQHIAQQRIAAGVLDTRPTCGVPFLSRKPSRAALVAIVATAELSTLAPSQASSAMQALPLIAPAEAASSNLP